MREIDAALDRVDDGTYGVCVTCGDTVGEDRLDALPASQRCAPCHLNEQNCQASGLIAAV